MQSGYRPGEGRDLYTFSDRLRGVLRRSDPNPPRHTAQPEIAALATSLPPRAPDFGAGGAENLARGRLRDPSRTLDPLYQAGRQSAENGVLAVYRSRVSRDREFQRTFAEGGSSSTPKLEFRRTMASTRSTVSRRVSRVQSALPT